jgi:glycosyltransferase involved in cell wall biosynthesis
MPRVFGGARLPLGLTVVHLQRVSDTELGTLYRNALCLVFPSLYEGFGIPPLEAMQCGCPVLAAAASSLPEVCGDAALYFDPHDPMSLTHALRRILADETLRRALIEAGLRRAAAFNWRASAALLSDAIARMAGTPAAVSQLHIEMP